MQAARQHVLCLKNKTSLFPLSEMEGFGNHAVFTLMIITAEYMNAKVHKRGISPSTVCMKKFSV